ETKIAPADPAAEAALAAAPPRLAPHCAATPWSPARTSRLFRGAELDLAASGSLRALRRSTVPHQRGSGRFRTVQLTLRQFPDTPPCPWTKFLAPPLFDDLADHAHLPPSLTNLIPQKGREFVRQAGTLAAGAADIQDRVHDLAQVVTGRPPEVQS